MINTDILIIGAGPAGLFTVFEAGLSGMHCHIIEALPQMGGQLAELYPKKPIFDIPGFPSLQASDLVNNLYRQIEPFQPGFTMNETAVHLNRIGDNQFEVITNKGTRHSGKAVVIAGGLGSFKPRKPHDLENLEKFEGKGVDYFVKQPDNYRDKRVVIAGGGDSALDWAIALAEVTSSLTLIHRRREFRGALSSVEKVQKLKDVGKINLITPAEVKSLQGNKWLSAVVVNNEGILRTLQTDYFIPLFGLVPRLGPLKDWGLEMERNAIKVDNATDYSTNIPGVYAVGDINTYPFKMNLILCGFHEAAMVCQSIYHRLNPDKKFAVKYTTVTGIDGFDGSRKEAEKPVLTRFE